jgi:hypothetical protein
LGIRQTRAVPSRLPVTYVDVLGSIAMASTESSCSVAGPMGRRVAKSHNRATVPAASHDSLAQWRIPRPRPAAMVERGPEDSQ